MADRDHLSAVRQRVNTFVQGAAIPEHATCDEAVAVVHAARHEALLREVAGLLARLEALEARPTPNPGDA